MKLSIVILNWNSKDYLLRCLQSLHGCSIGPREILVVDNDSQDGSKDLLGLFEKRGEVRAILNDSNRGVGPARNLAFCSARGEYLLSLDVDTQVSPGAIENLVAGMDCDSGVGLCGARLQGPNGERQNTCGEFPTLQSKMLRQLPFSLRRFLLRRQELLDWDQQGLRYVGWVTGACHLIRAAALREVGMYDPAIFYGPEDVDICLRMWLGGWKVLYNGEAVILHNEQHITKSLRSLFKATTRAHLRGLAHYFCKHHYLFRVPFALPELGPRTPTVPSRPGTVPAVSEEAHSGPGRRI